MHSKSLFRVLSVLAGMISCFLMLMFVFSLIEQEDGRIGLSFIIPAAAGFLFLGLMRLITRKDDRLYLTNREGFLFVTLSWVIASLLGALPFYLSRYIPSFIDALFETMSGLPPLERAYS